MARLRQSKGEDADRLQRPGASVASSWQHAGESLSGRRRCCCKHPSTPPFRTIRLSIMTTRGFWETSAVVSDL